MLNDAPAATPGRLKRSLLGLYFRRAGVDGMVNPFGLEVIANPDLLPFERPFVAAHEWSHLAGYAQESDANFVGWLTCIHGDAPSQYSGWLFLYGELLSGLDRDARGRVSATLDPGPRGDLEAIAQRVRSQARPAVVALGWGVYDQYLKANGVERGTRSYTDVVRLVLGTSLGRAATPGQPAGH